jgi:hypothetical protein
MLHELTTTFPYFIGYSVLLAIPIGAILMTLDWWLQRRRRARLDR